MRPAILVVSMLSVGCAVSSNARHARTAAAEPASVSSNLRLVPVEGLARIRVANDLAACVVITPQALFTVGDVELGSFQVQELKSIGECGCMSNVIAYSAMETLQFEPDEQDMGEPEQLERSYGMFVPTKGRPVTLVVSPDRRLFGKVPLAINIRCKGPD